MAQLTRAGSMTMDFPDFGNGSYADQGEFSNIRKSMRLGIIPLSPATSPNEVQLVTTTHPNLLPVPVGQAGVQVLRVAINMRGMLNLQSINNISFNGKGTGTTQVSAAKLFYTGSDGNFQDTNLLNTVNAPTGGMYNFTFNNLDLPHGTHYF